MFLLHLHNSDFRLFSILTKMYEDMHNMTAP